MSSRVEAQGSVIVVGGGVAGIAASVALADSGFKVTLLEKRPLLGGRASSFIDPQTGERLDECQHGTMRCCTNLADLLERLGVSEQIHYFDVLSFLDSEGKYSEIKGCGLPAPLHTSLSFLLFKSLSLADKIGIAKAMILMLRAGNRPEHATTSIGEWFRKTGQTERAIKRFWRPILVSACNEELDRIACLYAFKVFREGFLGHPTAYHFGVPRIPLGSLYTEPTLAYLKERGAEVRVRTIVEGFEVVEGCVTGVLLPDGTRLTADHYVSGLQFDLLLKALPESAILGVPYFENLKEMEVAPLAGIHLWFDRAFECPPAIAILDRETEWIFNKTENWALERTQGTYLSIVISASHRFAKTPKEELVAKILEEVRACIPGARGAELVKSQVIRWPKATLVPRAGLEALRPKQRSPLKNLYIAGEWTDTGWPSTMEAAARSGYLAVEALLEDCGKPKKIVTPDLPTAPLARLLYKK